LRQVGERWLYRCLRFYEQPGRRPGAAHTALLQLAEVEAMLPQNLVAVTVCETYFHFPREAAVWLQEWRSMMETLLAE
jgi:hypothetical protein